MDSYKGFKIGEKVHFGGVCIPDTWGTVVRFDKSLNHIAVEISEEVVMVHPYDLFHEGEQA